MMHIQLLLCLCSSIFPISIVCFDTYIHEGFVSSSVTMDCLTLMSNDQNWKFEDIVIYLNRIVVDDRFKGSFELLSNYSLHIPNTSTEHDGRYTCANSAGDSSVHQLIIHGLYS